MNFLSNDLFSKEHASSEKFDYFVCGVAGALFAYLGQTYIPQRLENWIQFSTPIALVFLSLSFYSGFRRIQVSNEVTRLNKEMLQAHEHAVNATDALNKGGTVFTGGAGEVLTREDLEKFRQEKLKLADKANSEAHTKIAIANRYGAVRDYLLFGGFLAILFSRIFQPYFGN